MRSAAPAAATGWLTTVAAAQDMLGSVERLDDVDVEAWIAQASARIASHCRRTFGRQEVEETFWPDRQTVDLVLRRCPIAAVVSVDIDSASLPAQQIAFDAEAGIVWRLSGGTPWAWRARRVVVRYTAGWALPGAPDRDLPADIEQACLRTVAAFYHARDRDPLLRSEAAQDIGSTSWLDPRAGGGGLPPDVAEALARWRL